jgi:hypothetical protein
MRLVLQQPCGGLTISSKWHASHWQRREVNFSVASWQD